MGESTAIVLKAAVVDWGKKSSMPYYLRMTLKQVDNSDQEILIQYMGRRQSELLREMLGKKTRFPDSQYLN